MDTGFYSNYGLLGGMIFFTIVLLTLSFINHRPITKRYQMMKLGMWLLLASELLDVVRHALLSGHLSWSRAAVYVVFAGYYLNAMTVMVIISVYMLLQLPQLQTHEKLINTIFFICEFSCAAFVLTAVQTDTLYYIRDGQVQNGIAEPLFFYLRLAVLIVFVFLALTYRRLLAPKMFQNWMASLLLCTLFHVLAIFIDGLGLFSLFANVVFAIVYCLFYSGHYEEGTARMGADMYMSELDFQLRRNKRFYVYEIQLHNYVRLLERSRQKYSEQQVSQLYEMLATGLSGQSHVMLYLKHASAIGVIAELDEEKNLQLVEKMCEVLRGVFDRKLKFGIVGIECPKYAADAVDIARLLLLLKDRCTMRSYYLCDAMDYESYCEQREILTLLKGMHVEKQDVVVFGRPVVAGTDEPVRKLEILCRLQMAGSGIVHADQIIELAERHGYIHQVNLAVLEHVCDFLRTPFARSRGMEVSLHISSDELENRNFVKDVLRILGDVELAPETLKFEVTMMQGENDIAHMCEVMQQLGLYQISFILSDFSPAYVNFESIVELPFREIKFAGECIKKAKENREYYDMVGLLVDVLRERGYEIAFTGVDDEELEELALSLGANYTQGAKYPTPFPIENIEELLDLDLLY